MSTADELFAELLEGIGELPSSLTIPLSPEITFGQQTFAELILREPTADQVRQAEEQLRTGPHMPSNQRQYQMHLISKVADVPYPVVQKMPIARLNVAMAFLNLFLSVGPGIGVS